MDRATIRQKKIGGPVRFEVTDQPARQSTNTYDRRVENPGTTCLRDAAMAQGLIPRNFCTHLLRRTKAVLIYRRTGT